MAHDYAIESLLRPAVELYTVYVCAAGAGHLRLLRCSAS